VSYRLAILAQLPSTEYRAKEKELKRKSCIRQQQQKNREPMRLTGRKYTYLHSEQYQRRVRRAFLVFLPAAAAGLPALQHQVGGASHASHPTTWIRGEKAE